VAPNGRAALDLLAAPGAACDAVLMDLQMPVMDGYAACEAIRAMGLHALPVIAMSANALDEDRRRSFEAGMDDHLSKPIDVDELVATLARLTGRAGAAASAVGGAALPELPGIDLRAALPRFGGSLDAFGAVFNRFAAGVGASVDALRGQLDAGEGQDALVGAHRLRGVAANLGATALASQAFELEAALRAGDDAGAAQALARLESSLAPLQAAARELAPAPLAAPAPQLDRAALAAFLDLLQNNNMKALAAHAALAPGLALQLGAGAARALAEAVATLRFEHAASLLAAILEPKGDA
jgi:CheY-like chemotaxis protein